MALYLERKVRQGDESERRKGSLESGKTER